MKNFNQILQYFAIKGVEFYRRFISPYKGFKCGHAYHTGSETCSTYGLKQLQKQNDVMEALRLIRHRLKACSHVTNLYGAAQSQASLQMQKNLRNPFYRKQAGFVDCDGCDVGHCDVGHSHHCDAPDCGKCDPTDACDVADICDCGNLFGSKNKPSKSLSGMVVTKKEGSYIIPNFQLLDELENDYLLYLYLPTKEYYKIHKSCVDCPVEDILNNDTDPETYKISEEKAKKILKYRKKVNLKKS